MRNKKLFTLAISLLLGGFAVTSLAGCGEEQTKEPGGEHPGGDDNPGTDNPGGEENPEENTYNVSLEYDNALGTVTASKTSGKAGETVTITITPNEDATIKSITINGESKTVANSVSFVTKEGTNTVSVVFEKKDKSFTVALEYDEEFGKVTVDKTEGQDYSAEDAAVTVTIEPFEHYKVAQILINGQERSADELEFTFVPQQGHNLVKVVFAQMSNFEELGAGYNVDTTNFSYKGTPDFTKEEFLTLANNGLKNVDVTDPDNIKSVIYYLDVFYDKFVSTFDIKKTTLEKAVELLKEEEFDILIQSFTTGYQNPEKNQFEFIVDLVSLFVDNFTEEEFVKIMFMGYSFFQFGYVGMTYSANLSYSGLQGSQIEDAEKYFRANNNLDAANELSAYINTSYFNEGSFGKINEENAKTSLSVIRAVYQMVTRALTIDTGEDSLGIKIQNVSQFVYSLNSGEFLNPENYEKDYETVKFLGQVIGTVLPSYKSFKNIFEILDEGDNLLKFMQDFMNYVNGTPYLNGMGEALPAYISNNSESVYYTVKYLGAFFEDLTLEDYKGAMALIGEMLGNSQSATSDYYAPAVKLSKLIVNNLVSYGADADKIKEYLSEGLYIYFDIGNIFTLGNIYHVENSYGTYKLTVTSKKDLRSLVDQNKIVDFINEVSAFDGDNLTEENKQYIDEFIQYLQTNLNSDQQLVKYTDYLITVNHEAKVGTELLASAGLAGGTEKPDNPIDFSKIENFNKDVQNKGLASINIAENLDLIIPYNRYLNEGESYEISTSNSMIIQDFYALVINKNVKFSDEDRLIIRDDRLYDYSNPPSGEEDPSYIASYKLSELNLDLTTKGMKYAQIEYEEGKYFYFSYFVFDEDDVKSEYEVADSNSDSYGPYYLLNLPGEITNPYIRKYVSYQINSYERQVTVGREDLQFANGTNIYYLDTSKAGHFTTELEFSDGAKSSFNYSVYDPQGDVEVRIYIESENGLDGHGRNDFEYQNKEKSKYSGYISLDSDFIDGNGDRKYYSRRYNFANLTADDFENKLDNSTPGPKTDTLNLKLGDKVYKFDFEYIVNEALEDNDTEYYWNFETRGYYYLVGFGYSHSLMQASKAKEEKYRDYNTGEIIDLTYNLDWDNYLSVDAENVSVPEEEIKNHETSAFVEFTSRNNPESTNIGKVKIVYQDEYELYDGKFSVPYDGFGLEYLLEQEFLVVRHEARAKFYKIYERNGELLDTAVSRLINIPIDDIRDQLVANGVGTHTLKITIDGVVYDLEYTVG